MKTSKRGIFPETTIMAFAAAINQKRAKAARLQAVVVAARSLRRTTTKGNACGLQWRRIRVTLH
jgi:hypothetical protein